MPESLQLGGNIELSGFREIDPASMIIVKKIVGNYARRFSDLCSSFEKLSLTMKTVHETEASKKFEIDCIMIDSGKNYSSSVTDRNIFVVIDSVLKKVVSEVSK